MSRIKMLITVSRIFFFEAFNLAFPYKLVKLSVFNKSLSKNSIVHAETGGLATTEHGHPTKRSCFLEGIYLISVKISKQRGSSKN
jgi:hypothetical protein